MDTKEKPEFAIGEYITVDRYNHAEQPVVTKIEGYGTMLTSNTLTYEYLYGATKLSTTGICIVESEKYDPARPDERHDFSRLQQVVLDDKHEKILDELGLKKAAYFSFGHGQHHAKRGQMFDVNVLLRMVSDDPRASMFNLFGDKFCMEYADKPNMKFFPDGVKEIVHIAYISELNKSLTN